MGCDKVNIEDFLRDCAQRVDQFLEKRLPVGGPVRLQEALRYGVIGGGKKLRASLLFATCEAYNLAQEKLLPLAGAIEMIHSFSLAHDDLPCMDNDDFRRGKPSMHRAFGEAMGVLAGDALLIEGLSLFLTDAQFLHTFGAAKIIEITQLLLAALGVQGMVGGQVWDLEYEKKRVTEEEVRKIYLAKTARFIQFPILSGAILGGADQKEREILGKFGLQLGVCFQAKDDILDVTEESSTLGKTAGKDLEQDKATLIKVKGLQRAQEFMWEEFDQAVTLLSELERPFPRLLAVARLIVERSH